MARFRNESAGSDGQGYTVRLRSPETCARGGPVAVAVMVTVTVRWWWELQIAFEGRYCLFDGFEPFWGKLKEGFLKLWREEVVWSVFLVLELENGLGRVY